MRWAVLWILLIGLVLLPFLLFEQQFNAFAEHITRDGTSKWLVASAVFALLALDVFLPVPSSIVSTASGVLLGFGLGSAVVWTGMMAGCLVGYAIGARGSGAARRFIGDDGMRRASALMQRYGDLALVLCRPVPVLAEASVVFAGLVRSNYGRFGTPHRRIEPGHRRRLRRRRRLLAPPGFVFVPDCVRWCLASSRAFHLRVAQDVWTHGELSRKLPLELATHWELATAN